MVGFGWQYRAGSDHHAVREQESHLYVESVALSPSSRNADLNLVGQRGVEDSGSAGRSGEDRIPAAAEHSG